MVPQGFRECHLSPRVRNVTDVVAYLWEMACQGDLAQLMKYVSGWLFVVLHCRGVSEEILSSAIYIVTPSKKLSLRIFYLASRPIFNVAIHKMFYSALTV